MKILGKLKINSENLLRNEDLVNLRGGYGIPNCSLTNSKDACIGVVIGADCCWTSNSVVHYARCLSVYGQPITCSDLN